MNTRYYQVGGFTIQVNSELPITRDTFHPKLKIFETNGPAERDNIVINHYFAGKSPVDVTETQRIYFKKPWAIFEKEDLILYEWLSSDKPHAVGGVMRKIAANRQHTRFDIYNGSTLAEVFRRGTLQDITLLPTDQILLCRVLGYHHGCLIHSLGLIYKETGYLFIGHSGAGKTTLANIMKSHSTILCDDRNIIRKHENGYRVYGTWRHSDLPLVSAKSAPLSGVFFLNQSNEDRIEQIHDRKQIFFMLMDHLVTSLVTHDWMALTMETIEHVSKTVPCHHLYFNKSGGVRSLIDEL